MSIHIRKAAPSDCDVLMDIRNQALIFKLSVGDDAWGEAQFTRDEILAAIARDTLYLVNRDDTPVASMVIWYADEYSWSETGLDDSSGYIGNLAVGDDFRGNNLGKKMLDWASSEIKSNAKQYIRLDCPADNRRLCSYYEQQGFVRMNPVESSKALYQRNV